MAAFKQPRDVRLHALRLAVLNRLHHVMIIPHQDEKAFVDEGRIVQLFVGMAGGQRRDGRIERSRVPQPGVEIAGGERAGNGARRAGTQSAACGEPGRPPACYRASSSARY